MRLRSESEGKCEGKSYHYCAQNGGSCCNGCVSDGFPKITSVPYIFDFTNSC